MLVVIAVIGALIALSALRSRPTQGTPEFALANPAKDKVTVVLPSYDRPHNLGRLLPILANEIEAIDQILVLHGSQKHAVRPLRHRKIEYINDFNENETYGAGRRFRSALPHIRNDFVLSLDDDLAPSNALVNRMIAEVKRDSMGVYGPFGRNCDARGYETAPGPNARFVLTNIAMTSLEAVRAFVDHWNEVEALLRRTHGNGDDLVFNYILLKHFPQRTGPRLLPAGGIGQDRKLSHLSLIHI